MLSLLIVGNNMKPNIARVGLIILGLLCLIYTFQPSMASTYGPEPSTVGNRENCQLRIHSTDGNGNALIANLYVDGSYTGYSNYLIQTINNGSHIIEANLSGYETSNKTAVCNNGEVIDVYLTLKANSNNKCTLIIQSGDEDDGSLSANIYVDGTYKGYTDQMSVQVNKGSHTVRAERSGYGTDEKNIECTNGGEVDVFLNLDGQSSQTCTLRVHVRDNDENSVEANIYVDGTYRGYNDYLTMTVDSGSHDVRASRSGYGSDTNTVSCHDGDTIDTYLNLDSNNNCDNGNCGECRFKIYVHNVNGDNLDAKLYLDGDYFGSSDSDYDYKTIDVDEGSHVIWVQKSGYLSQDKEADCENGRTQNIYFTLRKSSCDEYDSECQNEAVMQVTAITIDPLQPKLGDITRGEVKVKLLDTFYSSVDAVVNVYVDGNLEKSVSVRFNKDDSLEKLVTFAFNTLDYGIGSHNIEVQATSDAGTVKKTKSFSIIQGEIPQTQNCTDAACRIDQKHCLKVKDIQLENPNVKVGETARIDVTVSNCGDFKEDGAAVRLENSAVKTSNTFSINEGDEQKVSFDYEVNGEENLIFTAFDNFYKDSKSFRIKPESGYLSIYLDPSYTINTRKDNTITFRVKNIGVVSDTFDLSISDNIRPWTYGLAGNVTLMPGEEKNLQMTINPGSTIGTFDFGITAATAFSQKTVNSQLNVSDGFNWTGFFAMIGNYGWLPWLILILLISIILFLIAREIQKRMKGSRKQTAESRAPGMRAEEVTTSRVMAMSEEEQEEEPEFSTPIYSWKDSISQVQPASGMEIKGKPSVKRKKFWWDNDCVER